MKQDDRTAATGSLEPRWGTPLTDAELVHAAARADKQAFVEIVARNQAMVCAVALGIVGNIAASEDVAQEAFLTAWRKIHELRDAEKLKGWLRQIARHAALGYLRRQRGHEALDDAPEMADVSPAPDEQAASREEAVLLRDALSQLPEMYREPLVLFYREHQSTKAVADALELSEDAVRQRLARGREMLRERLAEVVERVLRNTRPTPLFTITFAAAIGALTSPSAVAGSVFAAAAGTPPNGPGSIFKSFKAFGSSKIFLSFATIAFVATIPLGYHLRAQLERSRPVPASVPWLVDAASPAESRPAALSPIFAEWKRLHEVHGTNLAAMPGIYREISGFRENLRRQGFRAALMAEWVQLDPTNVMAGFRERVIDPGQRRQFVDEWLAHDAVAAVEMFRKGGRTWESIVRSSLPALARRAPERVAEFVQTLPRPGTAGDTQVVTAFAIVAQGAIERAREGAEGITNWSRGQALAGVAQTWGARDLDDAIAWARRLPAGTDANEVIRSALVGAAAIDPLSALERVSLVPPGGRKGDLSSTTGARVLEAAAAADFDATMGWLAVHPSQLGANDAVALTTVVAQRLNTDAIGFLTRSSAEGWLKAVLPALTNALVQESSGQRQTVWEWLQGQSDQSTTLALGRHLLRTWGEQDMSRALSIAAQLPQTQAGDAQLELLAEGLLRRGMHLHRLDPLLEASPQRVRQVILQKAFELLTSETLGEPRRWMALLPQLPPASQARAAGALAQAWAAQAPADAIRWADSLPAGSGRTEAVAGIAAAWTATDPASASVWIEAMAPGEGRDRCAQSLISAIAQDYPREAWEWAMSIGEPERRLAAASEAADAMATRDPVATRAWIENSLLASDQKVAIQSALPPEVAP